MHPPANQPPDDRSADHSASESQQPLPPEPPPLGQGGPPLGYPPQAYAPHAYPPPPPGRTFPWWGFLLAGCGCLILFVPILAAILLPVFSQARESARSVSCLSNQKQVATGLLMYTQDYDERMPGKDEWMTAIEPYMRSGRASDAMEFPQFHCPTVSQRDETIFGYAFSSGLDRIEMSKLGSPRTSLMTFDSIKLTKNANDSAASLPSPPRHRRGNNVSFADGHASRIYGQGGPGSSPTE